MRTSSDNIGIPYMLRWGRTLFGSCPISCNMSLLTTKTFCQVKLKFLIQHSHTWVYICHDKISKENKKSFIEEYTVTCFQIILITERRKTCHSHSRQNTSLFCGKVWSATLVNPISLSSSSFYSARTVLLQDLCLEIYRLWMYAQRGIFRSPPLL